MSRGDRTSTNWTPTDRILADETPANEALANTVIQSIEPADGTPTQWTFINDVPAEEWVKYEHGVHWHAVEQLGIELMKRGAKMRQQGEFRVSDAQDIETRIREEEEEALHGGNLGFALSEKIKGVRKGIDRLLRLGYDLCMDGDEVRARGAELQQWATEEHELLHGEHRDQR